MAEIGRSLPGRQDWLPVHSSALPDHCCALADCLRSLLFKNFLSQCWDAGGDVILKKPGCFHPLLAVAAARLVAVRGRLALRTSGVPETCRCAHSFAVSRPGSAPGVPMVCGRGRAVQQRVYVHSAAAKRSVGRSQVTCSWAGPERAARRLSAVSHARLR